MECNFVPPKPPGTEIDPLSASKHEQDVTKGSTSWKPPRPALHDREIQLDTL